MTKEEHQQIINYCENMTASGATLSVSWDGGGDSGVVTIELDDTEVSQDSKVEKLIEDCVLSYLGYGNFAGSFSAYGTATYNSEDQCFDGEDTCIETDTGVAEFDELKFIIPENIWFNELRIAFLGDEDGLSGISVQFIIENGPRTEAHTALEETIKTAISQRVEYEIQNLNELTEVTYDETFSRRDLTALENDMEFVFKRFDYSYDKYDVRDVTILLTDQPDMYDNL